MITYGSAQVNGLPLTISAITPGTRQLLHTAPPGDATPHRIMVYGAMLNGYVATYLKIVVETADGEIVSTTIKYLKGNAFLPCLDSYLQLNGGCKVSVYAEGANACMVTAQVDDQSGATLEGNLAILQAYPPPQMSNVSGVAGVLEKGYAYRKADGSWIASNDPAASVADVYHVGDGVEKLAIILARAGLINYALGADDLTLGGLVLGHPVIRRSHDLVMNGLTLGGLTLGTPRPIPNMRPNSLTLGGLSLGAPELTRTAAFAPPAWIEYDDTYNAEPPDNDVTRALGTGPYTDVAASFWLKTDDAAHLFMRPVCGYGANNSNIEISIDAGSIWYYETSDNGNVWEHNWSAAIPTDGRWHHYAVKAGYCWIDGLPVTFADSGTGEDPGSAHPSITGDATIMRILLPTGKKACLADVRIFKKASDVAAQAIYGSPLLDDGATTIVGAWRMGDGPGAGTAFDRSVKAAPLDVVTGMTWGGVKDTRILVVGWDCGSVFVSPHTGDDWTTPIASGEWGCCAMDKTGQYQITGAGIDWPGELKVSTDYGATWVTKNPGGGDPNRDWSYGCAIADDASIMLATDGNTLYKSTDHGENWTTVDTGGTGAYGRCALCGEAGGQQFVSKGSILWVSNNYGGSWTIGPTIDPGMARIAGSAYAGVVAVLGDDMSTTIHISTDYGETWTPHSQPVLGTGICAVACNHLGTSFVVGGYSRLITSSDGGATWIERRPAGDTDHIWGAVTMDASGKIITAFNYDSKGYRSFDGGENWTEITPPDAVSGGFYDAAGSRT